MKTGMLPPMAMSHPLESKPIQTGDQPIESPEPLLEGLRQIAQMYPLPDTVLKEARKKTRSNAEPMTKNEAVAFFKDAYIRARLNTPSELVRPFVIPHAFFDGAVSSQMEDVRETLATYIYHAEELTPLEQEAATIWNEKLTETQRKQVTNFLRDHGMDEHERTYMQKVSVLELIDRDWLGQHKRQQEEQEVKRSELASQQFARKINTGVTRVIGSVWSIISGASEGVALGITNAPAVGAVFGPAMEIAGAIAIREAVLLLTNASGYRIDALAGGVGLGFAGLWLTATGARVVYTIARKILNREVEKRKAAILSTIIAVGTIAGTQVAAPVIIQFAVEHQPNVVVIPNATSEQPVRKSTENPSYKLKTDISPSPFATPFVWESPHIAKRVFDSVDWARVDRWEYLIDDALKTTGLGDQLKSLGYDGRAIVKSIMLVESRGNEKAISRAGAVGLLQVMPSDGPAGGRQCTYGPCFKGRSTTFDLFDPVRNLHDGLAILKGNLDRENGNLQKALDDYGGMGWEYSQFVLTVYNAIYSPK